MQIRRYNINLKFKEIFCADCKMMLARYSTKYFTDLNINALARTHFSMHIKEGHSIEMRLVEAGEYDTKDYSYQ